jgi:hypothetical protein
MHIPADPVEFDTRLAALERRLAEYETREQRLLELIDAVQRLTDTIGPLVKARSAPRPEPDRHQQEWPLPAPSAGPSGPVAPERIAFAHARLRETLSAGPPAEDLSEGAPAEDLSEGAPAEDLSEDAPAEGEAQSIAPPGTAVGEVPPPGRKSWLLRSLRSMVRHDPQAAGSLVHALAPAHALAGLPPLSALPGPPDALASVLVVGRLRRRVRWEKARLECPARSAYALMPLARLRASPAQLWNAGVRPDPALAFTLLAHALEPAWTAGHRFTIAHRGPDAVTYFSVRERALPAVTHERPSAPIVTTISCLDEALFAVLSGELPPAVTVLGAIAPLELLQRWFARASSG